MGVCAPFAKDWPEDVSTMGLFKKSSDYNPTPPNPDPWKFEIESVVEVGTAVVALVKYPGCTTFDGNKLLVYANTTKKIILQRNKLDPHFYDDKSSPVARFTLRDGGMEMAMKFAVLIGGKKK